MQEHFVVKICVNPSIDHLFDLAEIEHHPTLVKRI